MDHQRVEVVYLHLGARYLDDGLTGYVLNNRLPPPPRHQPPSSSRASYVLHTTKPTRGTRERLPPGSTFRSADAPATPDLPPPLYIYWAATHPTLPNFFGSWTVKTAKFNPSSLPMEMSEHDDNKDDYMQLITEGSSWTKDELPTQHLKLDISNSLLSSVRLMLPWLGNDSNRIKHSDMSKCEELRAAQNQLVSDMNSKQVPTKLPLLSLSVGNIKLIRTAECDIFARFYYLTKKIVCQMRIGTLSRKVVVPFSDIKALHVCFDHGGFDSLRIEAKASFRSFSAVNTHLGKYPDWKVEDPEDVNRFPESKFAFLEIEKGVLVKGFAKLLYTDPRLERVVNFSRGTCSEEPMHHGLVNAQMQQTNVSALHSLSANFAFPYIGT